MPPILYIILATVALLVALVLILAARKPAIMRVERTATIQAPAEKIFAILSDFRSFPNWSPWEKLDPGMKRTLSGSECGVGAVYEWEGNKKVGQGRMEILEVTPGRYVKVKLTFIKPFPGDNLAEYTMVASGAGTAVTWLMHGPNAFMARVMQNFMDIEGMVGKDFENGLANLKALVEG